MGIEGPNKEGRVEDPRVAVEMAHVEKPFREQKRFGIFGPSKETIQKGEKLAEQKGTETAERLAKQLEAQQLRELREKVALQLDAAVTGGKQIGTQEIGGHRYASGMRSNEVPLYELDVSVDVPGGGAVKYVGTGKGALTGEILHPDIELNGKKVDIDKLTPNLLVALSKALGVEVTGSVVEHIQEAHRR